jgi:hypothetical protein
LGISVPANKEPFRARFWLVLTREKDIQREMLMHSKMDTLSSLSLSIRYTGPADEPNAAWADLIHRLEVEFEEQILRFKLNISEKPQLEWSWQDELSRGGMECTILVYIHTGVKGVSVQKRKYL